MKSIWRDKKGRFVSYGSIINGPFLPPDHPIIRERMDRQMNRFWAEMLQSYMAPGALYLALKRA